MFFNFVAMVDMGMKNTHAMTISIPCARSFFKVELMLELEPLPVKSMLTVPFRECSAGQAFVLTPQTNDSVPIAAFTGVYRNFIVILVASVVTDGSLMSHVILVHTVLGVAVLVM
jgi:hypothetical protein